MENNEETVEVTESVVDATEGVTTEEIKNPEAVLAELRRAQEDLKTLRAELTSLTEERDSLKAAVDEDPFRTKAIDAETKLALKGLGLNDPDRLIRYIGRDGIDFDENGGLTGLSERIEQLKGDLPELFDVRRVVGGKADIFANDTVEIKKDPFRNAVHEALNGS